MKQRIDLITAVVVGLAASACDRGRDAPPEHRGWCATEGTALLGPLEEGSTYTLASEFFLFRQPGLSLRLRHEVAWEFGVEGAFGEKAGCGGFGPECPVETELTVWELRWSWTELGFDMETPEPDPRAWTCENVSQYRAFCEVTLLDSGEVFTTELVGRPRTWGESGYDPETDDEKCLFISNEQVYNEYLEWMQQWS